MRLVRESGHGEPVLLAALTVPDDATGTAWFDDFDGAVRDEMRSVGPVPTTLGAVDAGGHDGGGGAAGRGGGVGRHADPRETGRAPTTGSRGRSSSSSGSR